MTETRILEERNLSHVPSLLVKNCPMAFRAKDPKPQGSESWPLRQKPGALCSSYLALHFGKVSAQGSTSGPQAWSTHEIPSLWDLIPDGLRRSWFNNSRKTVHKKCNVLESAWNQTPNSGLWKNCLPRHLFLVPKRLEAAAVTSGDWTSPAALLTFPKPCWSAYGLQPLWIWW